MNTPSHSQTDTPEIDVIIPVYNGEQYILNAIQSVQNQTLKPKVIVIVNDGSTDKTEEVILKHIKNHPNSFLYIKQKNLGLSGARNTGIKKSKSDFVAFLDADDEWEKNKLELQYQKFKTTNYPNLGLVYCDFTVMNEEGKAIPRKKRFHLDPSIKGSVHMKLLEGNKIASSGSGALIKKQCLTECGMFDTNLSAAEDWDLWLRISKKYEVDYCAERLVKIRLHGNNMQKDNVKMLINRSNVIKKLAIENNDLPAMRHIKNTLSDLLVWNMLKPANFRLIRATIGAPTLKKIYGKNKLAFTTFLCKKILIKSLLFPFKLFNDFRKTGN